jgi:hypothetical protein
MLFSMGMTIFGFRLWIMTSVVMLLFGDYVIF